MRADPRNSSGVVACNPLNRSRNHLAFDKFATRTGQRTASKVGEILVVASRFGPDKEALVLIAPSPSGASLKGSDRMAAISD